MARKKETLSDRNLSWSYT